MRSSMKSFFKIPGLLAVAGVLTLSSAFAKDAVDAKANDKGAAESRPAAAIPECLAKLELTAEQQNQVKEIVGRNDAAARKIWGQFSERYTQMIAAESAMLAAIEDNLTEPQLVQIRTHRHKTAHHGRKVVVVTKSAAPAVTENSEELAKDGITLTAEQAAASDKIQELYHTNLHTLHHEIQGLHARLLALEADKLTQIEKVLTKEQVAQLKANRRNAPAAIKVTENDEPTKAEPAKAE